MNFEQIFNFSIACRLDNEYAEGMAEFEAQKKAISSAFWEALRQIPHINPEIVSRTYSPLNFGGRQCWDRCYYNVYVRISTERTKGEFTYKTTEKGANSRNFSNYIKKSLPREIVLDKKGLSGIIYIYKIASERCKKG